MVNEKEKTESSQSAMTQWRQELELGAVRRNCQAARQNQDNDTRRYP